VKKTTFFDKIYGTVERIHSSFRFDEIARVHNGFLGEVIVHANEFRRGSAAKDKGLISRATQGGRGEDALTFESSIASETNMFLGATVETAACIVKIPVPAIELTARGGKVRIETAVCKDGGGDCSEGSWIQAQHEVADFTGIAVESERKLETKRVTVINNSSIIHG